MNIERILKATAILLLVAAPATAAEPTAEELEQNRRKLQEWRAQPDKMQQLRKEAEAFFALPEDQRKRIMALDQELYQSSAPQPGLRNVMVRYVEWYDKLGEKDRQRIKDAPDKNARFAVVRELRDQEWMKHQPKALRDRYAGLEGNARVEFVKNLRLEDRQRRMEWQIAARFWKELDKGTPLPGRLTDFPADVVAYVTDYLKPVLTKEEEERLEKAQGQWPRYPMTLVELADAHPPALPGAKGPKSFAELPADVKGRFKTKTGTVPFKLVKAERTWPAFAVALATFAKERKMVLPHELWPWGYACLSPAMQEFVAKKLVTALDATESLRLLHSDGKWPEYPLAIQELARRHNLQVPWQTLPGSRERWDNYRVGRSVQTPAAQKK